jgi:diketogulonate reductase-like aldo/keto reductase
VVDLAKHYNKSAAQLLLRWSLQHDFIVIPKSDNPRRIEENAQIFDFEISDEDMQAMDNWK